MEAKGVAGVMGRAATCIVEEPVGVIVFRVPKVLADAAPRLSKAGLIERLLPNAREGLRGGLQGRSGPLSPRIPALHPNVKP